MMLFYSGTLSYFDLHLYHLFRFYFLYLIFLLLCFQYYQKNQKFYLVYFLLLFVLLYLYLFYYYYFRFYYFYYPLVQFDDKLYDLDKKLMGYLYNNKDKIDHFLLINYSHIIIFNIVSHFI